MVDHVNPTAAARIGRIEGVKCAKPGFGGAESRLFHCGG